MHPGKSQAKRKHGWHTSPRLCVPGNISLLPLPRYAPELNPVENLWEFLRANFLSHRVWDGYEAIVANGFLLATDLNTAAQQVPDTKWAIVDFPQVALTDKPKNVVGLTFK